MTESNAVDLCGLSLTETIILALSGSGEYF